MQRETRYVFRAVLILIVDSGIQHALCMLDIWGYKHTPRICNAYCFSTATVLTRTRLNVTFVLILHVLLLCLLYRTVLKISISLHAEKLLIEFVTSVCLPWTGYIIETVWGFININITGRWNLTFFPPHRIFNGYSTSNQFCERFGCRLWEASATETPLAVHFHVENMTWRLLP